MTIEVTGLNAAFFSGSAAVVGGRGDVADEADLEADGLERADGRFAPGARALDADLNLFHAVGHGLAGGILRHLLGGEGRALARAFEANATGAGPSEQVAVRVGDGDLGVVERGQDVGDAGADVLGTLRLDDLFRIGIFTEQFG